MLLRRLPFGRETALTQQGPTAARQLHRLLTTGSTPSRAPESLKVDMKTFPGNIDVEGSVMQAQSANSLSVQEAQEPEATSTDSKEEKPRLSLNWICSCALLRRATDPTTCAEKHTTALKDSHGWHEGLATESEASVSPRPTAAKRPIPLCRLQHSFGLGCR